MENIARSLKKDLKRFNKISLQAKGMVVVILIFSFILGVVVPPMLKKMSTKEQPSIQIQAQSSPKLTAQSAQMIFSTNISSVRVSDPIVVTVFLDSGLRGVEAADFYFTYDPQYLKLDSATSGGFFKSYPINTSTSGSVRISGMADFNGKTLSVPKGKGVVATLTFTALAPTTSTFVGYDQIKTVVASNGQNILSTSKNSGLSVSIK